MEDKKTFEVDLYSMNKQLMSSVKELDEQGWRTAKNLITDFFSINKKKFYMLLCHEKRDYTIFYFPTYIFNSPIKGAQEVKETLENRGKVKSVEIITDENVLEIWVDNNVYYLFSYEDGVVTI